MDPKVIGAHRDGLVLRHDAVELVRTHGYTLRQLPQSLTFANGRNFQTDTWP